ARRCRRRSWSALETRLAVDFHRAQRRAVAGVAACQPDVAGAKSTAAVAVDCEIPPGSHEVTARKPLVIERTIVVYFVGGIRRSSPPAHDVHLLRGLWGPPHNRSGFACGSRNVGDGGD